ncbi:DUF4184 family protein [Kineosporia succinea]|uniref:DUF4184 family protein n=1 Tax=Kineosporia succinea TaxID=84632 RepID=A0ABT9NYC4_9ACTN|nr:DUF4184 family protein [Kineosporia succinea]MDP9825439.1 hypothetical protein [Kineosporia succinea]
MPFTGSHPAAVLPLLGTRLVPSALVIGSMTPDLVYYVPLPESARWPVSHHTHTVAGIFGLDLVLGLAAFVVWQALIAPLAVAVAPGALRDRLAALPVSLRHHVGSVNAVALVVVSQLIGTVTHVLWDEFTHPQRFGTRHVPWLAQWHGPLEGYHWAQYGSGVFGLLAIGWVLARWWRSAPVRPRSSFLTVRAAALIRVAVVVSTVVGAGIGLAVALSGPVTIGRVGYDVSTYGGGAGAFTVLVCAVLVSLRRS